ncbi:MAG: HAMP domain-containing sensor histidine kinase [Planctomycetota bacterium]
MNETPPNRTRKPITLRTPIALGVTLIVLLVILTALWVSGTVIGILTNSQSAGVFIGLLAAGTVLLIAVLAGVIMYLTLSVKAFQLNRRQSNFIDSVTHELKSPIASLKLYLQTMSRHQVSIQQQSEFHQIMADDVERLDSLINHLLDTARVERGETFESTDVELEPLLMKAAHAACVRHKLPDETVRVTCPDLILEAPVIQLEIMFRNLIDNAVKYGGSPVRVLVEAACDDAGTITVSVIDNGEGIPANLRRKIFGRFVRLGNELERSRPGTGLGLYLVRNITHAIGGRINISDAKDTGVFEPVLAEDPSASEETNRFQTHQGTRFDITLYGGRIRPPAEAVA